MLLYNQANVSAKVNVSLLTTGDKRKTTLKLKKILKQNIIDLTNTAPTGSGLVYCTLLEECGDM